MAGITADGLTIKTLLEIKSEVEADEHANINASLDVSDETPIGQVNTTFSDQLSQAWEALFQVYAAAYRASATGVQLDNIGSLTGTERLAAVKSTTNLVAVGTNGTLLATSRIVSVAGAPASRFVSLGAATITTLAARAVSTAYAYAALRTNDGGKIYYCTKAGTSSAGAGPTGTGSAIVDGTATWAYVGVGSAAVVVAVQAEADGPTTASFGTLNVIETPVSGWLAAANPEAAFVGRLVETDEAYRIRQEDALTVTGAGTPDAIRADILDQTNVPGSVACYVFENVTDATDVNGVPPHAFETLVLGGADKAIIDTIWKSKPAGIQTYGAVSGTAVDAAGDSHTVKFSRPTEIPFYVTVSLLTLSTFPADGVAQVKQALVDFWAAKKIGDDVIRFQLLTVLDQVSGIYDFSGFTLGVAPAPVGTSNIIISSRQLATLAAANITVNVTPV
jgi:uncharacterized phage protein gp47/JayE